MAWTVPLVQSVNRSETVNGELMTAERKSTRRDKSGRAKKADGWVEFIFLTERVNMLV